MPEIEIYTQDWCGFCARASERHGYSFDCCEHFRFLIVVIVWTRLWARLLLLLLFLLSFPPSLLL